MSETVSVADAKKRFSELIDRVRRGERFIVSRRGKPALALVPPDELSSQLRESTPLGLAAGAGALSDWDDIESSVAEIYKSRRRARDRSGPDLG